MSLFADDLSSDRVAFSEKPAGVVDIIAVDYNYAPFNKKYVRVILSEDFSESTLDGYKIEFDFSYATRRLKINEENDFFIYFTKEVTQVWEVKLDKGKKLKFHLDNLDDRSDPGMALFAPGQSNPYQDRNSAAAISDANGKGEDESFVFTATRDGMHGLVVWFNTQRDPHMFKINIFDLPKFYKNSPMQLKRKKPYQIK